MKKHPFLFLFLLLPSLLFTQVDDSQVTLALLNFDNMESTQDYDYLGILFSALIKEDLSHLEGIVLVDREQLERIIDEQKQQLSGLMDESTTVEVGKLIGCDYLCGGSYVVMGEQVLLDLSVTEIETGRVVSFSTRGDTEDMVHLAAEKLVKELLGEVVILRTADSDTPILKHVQRDPGTLKFFSRILDARIYIDGEFSEYTTGDRRVPNLFELSPGKHTVMVDLGPNFGVIHEPEITFGKWEEEFEIQSGKTLVLEDRTSSLNERIFDLMILHSDDISFSNGVEPRSVGETFPFSFLDRQGVEISGEFSISLTPGEGDVAMNAFVTLTYQGEREELTFSVNRGKSQEIIHTKGRIEIKLHIENRNQDIYRAKWYLMRNDVYQGMHRE